MQYLSPKTPLFSDSMNNIIRRNNLRLSNYDLVNFTYKHHVTSLLICSLTTELFLSTALSVFPVVITTPQKKNKATMASSEKNNSSVMSEDNPWFNKRPLLI